MRKILLAATATVVAYLAVPPIIVVIFSAVHSSENKLPFEATSFTLDNLIKVFSSPVTYQLLAHTAYYTIGAVVLGLTVAVTFSWFLERTNMPFRRFFFVATLVPMGIPGIVFGMAWILLANPTNGTINVALRNIFGLASPGPLLIYSIPGMIIVTAMRFVPTMYLMISGVFSRIDPSLEEVGRTSGASPWDNFRRISMPLLAPAIGAALIYYTVIGIETFEIAALLGFPERIFVFSTAIYWAMNPPTAGNLPNFGVASTYALIILTAAMFLIYGYRRYARQSERFYTVTGRGYRPSLIDLGKWRFVPVIFMSVYFVVAVLLPLMILLWRAFAPPYSDISFQTLGQLSLNAFGRMIRYPGLPTAVKNSLLIGAVTACLSMLLVTLLSWQAVRLRNSGTAAFSEYLSFAVLGVPGIVLALSLIFIYAALPLPFYGTVWIIVIGLMTLTLPFGTRLMTAALLQIHRELEEAAEISGANVFDILTRVMLPLLWPSFLRGLLWVFVRCISDSTLTLMLQSYGNQTVTVALWTIWFSVGDVSLACAIALPLVALSLVLAFFVGRQSMLMTRGV